jgi:hypothetical protein
VEATIQDNISAFNAAFAEYVAYTSKTPQEALEHKLNNLGLALYRGFTAHEFGGVPRKRGVAIGELRARTAEKRGTRVRGTLMAEYEGQRDTLRKEAKQMRRDLADFNGSDKKWKGMGSALLANARKRIGAWHDIVGREIALRQSGIGELGAAFLWYRNRGKGEARRLVPNRKGQTIGSVTVEEGVATIIGSVDGLTTVDARYGVVSQAISDETDDTMQYIKNKQDAAAARFAGALPSI